MSELNKQKLIQLDNPATSTVFFNRANEENLLVSETIGEFGTITREVLKDFEFYVVGFKIYLESIGNHSDVIFSLELDLDAIYGNEVITLRKKKNAHGGEFTEYGTDTIKRLTSLLMIDKFGMPKTVLVVYAYRQGLIYRLILKGLNKDSFFAAYNNENHVLRAIPQAEKGLPTYMVSDPFEEKIDEYVLLFKPISGVEGFEDIELVKETMAYLDGYPPF